MPQLCGFLLPKSSLQLHLSLSLSNSLFFCSISLFLPVYIYLCISFFSRCSSVCLSFCSLALHFFATVGLFLAQSIFHLTSLCWPCYLCLSFSPQSLSKSSSLLTNYPYISISTLICSLLLLPFPFNLPVSESFYQLKYAFIAIHSNLIYINYQLLFCNSFRSHLSRNPLICYTSILHVMSQVAATPYTYIYMYIYVCQMYIWTEDLSCC